MFTCDMNRKNIEKEKIDFHFVDKRKMIWKWIRCRFQWSKSKANIKFENAFAVQKRFKTLSTYYLFFFYFFFSVITIWYMEAFSVLILILLWFSFSILYLAAFVVLGWTFKNIKQYLVIYEFFCAIERNCKKQKHANRKRKRWFLRLDAATGSCAVDIFFEGIHVVFTS